MAGKVKIDSSLAENLQRWMPKDRDYLIAVSGGCDSVALLHFLVESGYERLRVCHVNHQLRGERSEGDAEFVKSEAGRLGIPFSGGCVDVMSAVEEKNWSIETAARELRYGWLAGVAEETDCRRLITAHHADDQVETVLINLFRGSGNRGISGMMSHSCREVEGVGLELFRPFLGVSREEIEAYVKATGLSFREDESNAEDFALRNRVRHRLLPQIEEIFGRDVRGAVLRAAELARSDEQWVQSAVNELDLELGDGLDVKRLRELPPSLRDRFLRGWLREQGVPDCGFEEVARVAEVALSFDRPAKSSLPGDFHVRRKEGVLFLEPPEG